MSATKSAVSAPASNGTGADIVKIKGGKPNMLPVGQVVQVSPRELHVQPGMNPRAFNPADKTDTVFAESLRNGVHKPLEVRQDSKGRLFVMDGHRRLGAVNWLATEAKPKKVLATVPVIRLADERVSDEGKKGAFILSSANFKGLTPMEQGRVAARMIKEGWTKEAIAKSAGKTTAHIQFVLEMQDIPESVAKFVTPEGESGIASFVALQIVKEVGAERAAAAIQKAMDERTKKLGYGAVVRVTRKHLHEADEGIGLHVGDAAKAKRAPQASTANQPKEGESSLVTQTVQDAAKDGLTGNKPAVTPAAKPASAAKPVLEVNGFRVRVIDSKRVVATFDSTAEAQHYLPYLAQGFATSPVARPLPPVAKPAVLAPAPVVAKRAVPVAKRAAR